MSDARRQELERLAANGDPEAARALFLELARAGDPEFHAALKLRRRLREAFYEVVDAAAPPLTQPLARVTALSFRPLLSVLEAALGRRVDERADYAFEELAAGPARFAHQEPPRCGVLALRVGERVWVGVGVAAKEGPLRPSHLWRGLSPWRRGKRATVLSRLEAWVQSGDQRARPECRRQRLLETTREAARALVQLQGYAEIAGPGAWSLSHSEGPLRGPRVAAPAEEADHPVWQRLAPLIASWDPEELRALLLEGFARERVEDLYLREAAALAATLEGLGAGASRGPAEPSEGSDETS